MYSFNYFLSISKFLSRKKLILPIFVIWIKTFFLSNFQKKKKFFSNSLCSIVSVFEYQRRQKLIFSPFFDFCSYAELKSYDKPGNARFFGSCWLDFDRARGKSRSTLARCFTHALKGAAKKSLAIPPLSHEFFPHSSTSRCAIILYTKSTTMQITKTQRRYNGNLELEKFRGPHTSVASASAILWVLTYRDKTR